MKPTDDGGLLLNVEYEVEPDGNDLALVLHSSGGQVKGSAHARNHQYPEGLGLVLDRLRERGAVVVDGHVVSTTARRLPLEQRSIVPAPVVLAQVQVSELRADLMRRQKGIGENPDGNQRRRIRLRLSVPGYAADDAKRLEEDLAHPADRGEVPDVLALLRSLIGDPIKTVAGNVNTIMEVNDKVVVVATERSPQGQPVEVADVRAGVEKLYRQGSVLVSVPELGHRSAFVGAVMATLPGAVVSRRPAMVTLRETAFPIRIRQFAVLDGTAQVTTRKEQAELRRLLLRGRTAADCDLCGHEFPQELLRAAHIKRRALCTDEERNDLRNVAMLACTIGCDSLFEWGYVGVDEAGVIRSSLEDGLRGKLRDHLDELHGRTCGAHGPDSQTYFAWHLDNVFRRLLDDPGGR